VTGYRIPFNKPALVGNELRYITEAVERGHLSGDGFFTSRCSQALESALGVRRALLTTSCTHALEICALLLELQPGDEIIVPSFAFVTTANAFASRGATPVFADIRPDTLNLDESRLEERITPRTRAIVALHYAGVGCEMDEVMRIAGEGGIPVIEDNAHGFLGSYRGRSLGSFGSLATLSFHETKNFTSGEGGALLINHDRWIERAEVLREKGTDRSRFFRGEVDKYSWVDFGSSSLPSELVAAFLCAQLEARERIQKRRMQIWHRYQESLPDWAERCGVRLPAVPEHCAQSYHMYYLILPSARARAGLIEHLKQRGILAVFHFLPLHLSKMGHRYGGRPGDCPVSEDLSDRLLRLPFYFGLSEHDQDQVIEAIGRFGGT
jgi:dTDP-4-amino-4,6-dideoxygalactose transaminase